jgi:predicted TIM-barrel fold metal-dependent hydrolase
MYQIGSPVSEVAKIRNSIDHPIIDADAHVIEARFALHDFVKKIAGPNVLAAYEKRQAGRNKTSQRNGFWASPSGDMTIDRATVMLPGLYYERLTEAGIDFAIIYTSEGLGAQQVRDPELRQTLHRALNMLYADMFGPYADRMTASAVIPMHSPAEALAELEFAVGELGFKTVSIPGEWRGPVPEVAAASAKLGALTQQIHSFTIDSEMDYDPFWRRCVELGVAITGHGGAQSSARRMSPQNFVYNRLGSFGVGNEHLCRSLFMGGVTRRFPTLNIGFLEGGVGWASALYNDLCEFWEKRNVTYLRKKMDPADLDMDLMVEMFEKYGNEYLTAERIAVRQNADNLFSFHWEETRGLDDFEACALADKLDIRDLFVPNFYFGCEADDRMNAVAFNRKLNHFDVKLKALFSSDIGHWDVPDMRYVVHEAHEAVEAGLMDDGDFRDFMFRNVAELHVQMNPDFYKGTAVEGAVQKLIDDGEVVLPDHAAALTGPAVVNA